MRIPLVLSLGALALTVASCGGNGGGGDPVAKAAAATVTKNTEHVEFHGTTAQQGTTFVVKGSGDFKTKPQLGDLLFSFSSSQGAGSLHEVLKGWTVYMISDLFKGRLPAGKAWVSVNLQKAGRAAGIDFSSFSAATPAQTLAQLQATSKVQKLGSATVDGVEATHYRATINPNDVAGGKVFEERTHARYQPIDVWIDGRGFVRRIRIGYSTAKLGRTQMTMDLSKFGEPVSVTVPPPSIVYDATRSSAASLQNGGNG